MLVIKIELWPGGDESRKRLLHVGRIALSRVRNGNARGDYKYWLSQAKSTGRKLRSGKVFWFPRKRLSAWDLLYRVLRDAVGERNE